MKNKKIANSFKIYFVILVFVLCCGSLASAQGSSSAYFFKKDVAYVMYGSIGGAVLGLSTLSFYGNPQEHSGNITTGAILGLLGGLGVVLFHHAQDQSGESEMGIQLIPVSERFEDSKLVLNYRF